MRKRDVAAVAAGLLVLGSAPISAAQTNPQPPSPAVWAAVVRCSAIANDDARHACLDNALANAGYGPDKEEQASERRRIFGMKLPRLGGDDTAPQATAPGRAQAPVREDANRIETALDSVTVRGDSKLILTTREGAVWAQIDGLVIWPPPRPGQSIVIRRNALGGYFCELKSWQAIRCERRN